jgi:hypothetical protein
MPGPRSCSAGFQPAVSQNSVLPPAHPCSFVSIGGWARTDALPSPPGRGIEGEGQTGSGIRVHPVIRGQARTQPNVTERFHKSFHLDHAVPTTHDDALTNRSVLECRDASPLSLQNGTNGTILTIRTVPVFAFLCALCCSTRSPKSNKRERFHKSFRFGPRCTNDLRRQRHGSFDFR